MWSDSCIVFSYFLSTVIWYPILDFPCKAKHLPGTLQGEGHSRGWFCISVLSDPSKRWQRHGGGWWRCWRLRVWTTSSKVSRKGGPESEVGVPNEFREQCRARCLVTTIALGWEWPWRMSPVSSIGVLQLASWTTGREVGRCARDGRQGKALLHLLLTSARLVGQDM